MTRVPLLLLSKQDAQYGRHSGYYEQAFRFAGEDGVDVQRIVPHPGIVSRFTGKLYSLATGAPPRDQSASAAEFRLTVAHRLRSGSLCHIANVEDHLPLVRRFRALQSRWVATVHFPPNHWSDADLAALRHLARVITLCERDRAFFADRLGKGAVSLILHGVDCSVFRPDEALRAPGPRLLFMGKWLRDFETAGRVFAAALDRWPALEIDVIVASRWADGSRLAALANHPRVHWQESVPDVELPRLYQRAWLLVMPLLESSANNALVEALACGTVPVVNRIGGVPDYGGGTLYPLCESTDVDEYLARIAHWLEAPDELRTVAGACRDFAIEHLDWPHVRRQHVDLYRGLLRSTPE
jgi:glycosyltransferase involved in cell wall biosynthesis